jgi:hypothetical protein
MSHTKGPWHVHWGTKYPYIKDSSGNYVLDNNGVAGYVRHAEDVALIAAAPELLSACIPAYLEIPRPAKIEDVLPGTFAYEVMHAIAKATSSAASTGEDTR